MIHRNTYDFEHVATPAGVSDPTLGVVSQANFARGVQLNQALTDGVNDIILGRRPIAGLDQLVKTWQVGGGNQIRTELQRGLTTWMFSVGNQITVASSRDGGRREGSACLIDVHHCAAQTGLTEVAPVLSGQTVVIQPGTLRVSRRRAALHAARLLPARWRGAVSRCSIRT